MLICCQQDFACPKWLYLMQCKFVQRVSYQQSWVKCSLSRLWPGSFWHFGSFTTCSRSFSFFFFFTGKRGNAARSPDNQEDGDCRRETHRALQTGRGDFLSDTFICAPYQVTTTVSPSLLVRTDLLTAAMSEEVRHCGIPYLMSSDLCVVEEWDSCRSPLGLPCSFVLESVSCGGSCVFVCTYFGVCPGSLLWHSPSPLLFSLSLSWWRSLPLQLPVSCVVKQQ